MEQAVLDGDVDHYMEYVWNGDPMFRTEQSRWAQDWQEHPLSRFALNLYGIQEVSPTVATARITIDWRQRDRTDEGSAGGATVSVIFYYEGDRWLFGGENWEVAETEGLRLDYFANAILDNRAQAQTVEEYLPGIYNRVTAAIGFAPEETAEIKMYDSVPTLQTLTRISMPHITQWNEPGEAIKITLGPSDTPPLESDIAREYTRFVLYQMSGGERIPWWLEDGIAEYGSSLVRTLSQNNRLIRGVAALINDPTADPGLMTWDTLNNERSAYSAPMQAAAAEQTFTLVYYIYETYGDETLRAWIQALTTGDTVEDATQQHLNISLDDLETQWREWLLTTL
jgi:hypothetical protein